MPRKDGELWWAREFTGTQRVIRRFTLKSICAELGIKYNTAKINQDKSGGITVWKINNTEAWEVWVETVKK